MNKVICPGCGKTIVDCRRYPIEALAAYLRTTIPAACRRVGISGTVEQDARCHGISRRVADRVMGELHEHPAVIWPEIVDHDIADVTRTCIAEDCDQTFVGHANRRYCSPQCRRRVAAQLFRLRHPDKYMAESRAWKERNRESYREYNRRYQRRYMRLRRERQVPGEEAA